MLHDAAYNGRVECAQVLLQYGDQVDKANNFGQTPLHAAAYLGRLECAQELLQHGAQVDKADDVGLTPLHLAVVVKAFNRQITTRN